MVDSMVGSGVSSKISLEEIERMARVTPLRLSYDERVFLRLLESTLEVSEYTDKVDILHHRSAAKQMAHEIKQIYAVLSGLSIAHQYDVGQRLIKERDFNANADFFRYISSSSQTQCPMPYFTSYFRNVFEIGRRYKILNPERMRDSYGKLIYFLMDSRKPEVSSMLSFDSVAEVKTVLSLLEGKKNGRALLSDPILRLATAEIMPEGKSRSTVQYEIQKKEEAIKILADKYSTASNYAKGTLFSRLSKYALRCDNYFDDFSELDFQKRGIR